MKKLINLALLATIFVGCSNKEYVHDPLKNELLAYTQKFEAIRGNTDRYLAVASYLNPVLADASGETFLLSSYPQDEDIKFNTLKVNGDSNLSVKKVKEGDKILEITNINLPWSNHYELISPVKEADYLTITYETEKNTKVSLKFLKVSKSMYWKPEIKLKDD